jgi:hypothetical protein
MKPWPSSWPSRIQIPFPASAPPAGRYRPLPGTRPFWNVYSKTTEKLRTFIGQRKDQAVEEFLEFLIGGFYAEYERWDKLGPGRAYFTLFRRARFRSLSLVAHAYFHMGYDLPRTIADALTASPSLDILTKDRNDARKTFVRLNHIFPEVFAEESRSYSSNGIFGLIGRIVPLSITKIPAYWVIQMRTVAWINAEVIADELDLKKREQIEDEILTCVVKAGQALERKRWNPALWLTVLPAPTVAVIAGYLQLSADAGTVAPWLAVLIAAFLLLSTYIVLAYWGLTWISDELGREITHNLEEILPPDYRDRLGLIRREIVQRTRGETD